LSGGVAPTGSITFTAFGPGDATCTGSPAFTSTNTVTGNTSYPSNSFTTSAAGTYEFVAAYSGDANNTIATTSCGDPAEAVVVSPLPQIAVTETVSPVSQPAPKGTFTFTVTVSNPSTVVPVTVNSLDDNVYGSLATLTGSTCSSLIGTKLDPGATSAACTFSGSFAGVSGNSQTDTVTVTGADGSGNVAHATAQATVKLTAAPAPEMNVTTSVKPATLAAPGGNFTFTVTMSNPTTADPVKITSLSDSIYGNLATRPSSSCQGAIGASLGPSTSSTTCAFTGPFTGKGQASQTDTVTAAAADASGATVSATANTTVTLSATTSTIGVTQIANPQTLPTPGGSFSFTVAVSNLSTDPVTVTAVTDSVYGNVANRPASTCGSLIGQSLGPAETSPCTYVGALNGPTGTTQATTLTVSGMDSENNPVKATVQTVVAITAAGVAPGVIPSTGQGAAGATAQASGSPLAFTGLNDRPIPVAFGMILTGMLLLIASQRRRRDD
jgi:hypothetical protein